MEGYPSHLSLDAFLKLERDMEVFVLLVRTKKIKEGN